jgi:hypothetical protein
MRKRKKRKVIIAPKCHHCKQHSETFVVTAEGKIFCMIYQMIGVPPIRDCMTEYNRGQKYVR